MKKIKTSLITIRVTEDEKQMIQKLAKESNVSMSKILLNGYVQRPN
jgi:uncharacterized protein (DUF1778 family)